MKKMIIAAMSASWMLVSGQGIAADIEAGKKKASETCAACHGADGNSPTPNFPKLAGQHADYLAKALNDYKSGARKNPIMGGLSAALSKQDVENLAAYYATQPGLKTK
ncbi:MAG: hypothetical protein RL610_931 [Pseudomonadota bacterium]|jgi:cytochrome c553